MTYSVKEASDGKSIDSGDVKINNYKFHHHFISTGSHDTSELISMGIQKMLNNPQLIDALMTNSVKRTNLGVNVPILR